MEIDYFWALIGHNALKTGLFVVWRVNFEIDAKIFI
jgi:hypothetical protein